MGLDSEIRIGQAQALSDKLRGLLDPMQREVWLDASRVETIDTCGLQLLTSFVRDCTSLGVALRWSGVSEPFRKAATLLDLEQHLELVETSDSLVDSGVFHERPKGQPRVVEQVEHARDRETVRILHLGIAQIAAALAESDDGIATLSGSLANIGMELKAMEQAVWEIPSEDVPADLADMVEGCRQAIAKKLGAAIVGVQFYDQLVQRLSHVRDSLACLAELVADESRACVPEAWVELRQTLRDRYSMSQERNLFDAVMNGKTPEDGMSTAIATESEVEWFQDS